MPRRQIGPKILLVARFALGRRAESGWRQTDACPERGSRLGAGAAARAGVATRPRVRPVAGGPTGCHVRAPRCHKKVAARSGGEKKSGGELAATFWLPLLGRLGPVSGQETAASGGFLARKWQGAHCHFLAATFRPQARLAATFWLGGRRWVCGPGGLLLPPHPCAAKVGGMFDDGPPTFGPLGGNGRNLLYTFADFPIVYETFLPLSRACGKRSTVRARTALRHAARKRGTTFVRSPW